MRCLPFIFTALLTLGSAAPTTAPYADHSQLLVYRDEDGRMLEVRTVRDWERRREDILRGMQEAMGKLPDRRNLPALDLKIGETMPSEKFTRLTISFVVDREERIPAILFLPKMQPEAKKLPGILALHQTAKLGKRETEGEGKPNMTYGLELTGRGYVVLCPDYPSFGDYPCDFKDPRFASGTIKGIFNHMRCVDLLQSLPQVDPQHIGVIGHSLGGHNALFVAAFDNRIKAVVSSCGWTPFADYYGGKIAGWTSPRYMPRLRDVYGLDPKRVPFDFYEVLAAIAPRPLFSNSPVHDDNFSVDGVKKAAPRVRKVYELYGASDALVVRHPDCGHDFPPEVREEVYEFLDRALKRKF
jgi:pimeloyl-ACP methyl ester carboxylesterase